MAERAAAEGARVVVLERRDHLGGNAEPEPEPEPETGRRIGTEPRLQM